MWNRGIGHKIFRASVLLASTYCPCEKKKQENNYYLSRIVPCISQGPERNLKLLKNLIKRLFSKVSENFKDVNKGC